MVGSQKRRSLPTTLTTIKSRSSLRRGNQDNQVSATRPMPQASAVLPSL
jgi:hypothetical protein